MDDQNFPEHAVLAKTFKNIFTLMQVISIKEASCRMSLAEHLKVISSKQKYTNTN